jgi:hypothetical protein
MMTGRHRYEVTEVEALLRDQPGEILMTSARSPVSANGAALSGASIIRQKLPSTGGRKHDIQRALENWLFGR